MTALEYSIKQVNFAITAAKITINSNYSTKAVYDNYTLFNIRFLLKKIKRTGFYKIKNNFHSIKNIKDIQVLNEKLYINDKLIELNNICAVSKDEVFKEKIRKIRCKNPQ